MLISYIDLEGKQQEVFIFANIDVEMEIFKLNYEYSWINENKTIY